MEKWRSGGQRAVSAWGGDATASRPGFVETRANIRVAGAPRTLVSAPPPERTWLRGKVIRPRRPVTNETKEKSRREGSGRVGVSPAG